MNFTPAPYQRLMHDHLVARERAAAFVGLGLGKTAATLSAFATLRADCEVRTMLVVAPLRVANLTWPNEIAKWAQFRGWRVENLRREPPSGRAQIYTLNYESLHKLRSLNFADVVVFDELTRAKNPSSARIRGLRPLLRPNIRRWGLTGTPRPNSLLELFAQIRLLDDGERLGRSYNGFRQAWFTAKDWNEYQWEPRPDAEETVYGLISDLAITLRSSDWSDVADTVAEDIPVPLPDKGARVYRTLERELLAILGGREVVAVNAAVLVNKLLQVCGGAVYDSERSVVPVHDGKINALRRLAQVHPGERLLVATNFIHERERVVAALPGAVDAAKFKGDIEDAWNSGRIPHLVADPRSLGHGLNLQHGGRTVVWFSPTWSRELYDQFNARVARKGQTSVPRVFRLHCPDTIDDAVLEALRTRGSEQEQMLSVLTNLQRLRT